MKRSEINMAVAAAAGFFAANQFALPPFAYWTRQKWCELGRDIESYSSRKLGWDVTDFNSGCFETIGLTLFTLRNGTLLESSRGYAEKIMHVRDQQVTPLHYHYRKTEDIINRGNRDTGNLCIKLYNSKGDGGLADTPVTVICDGLTRKVEPGGEIVLHAGESITIPPLLYHSFHAVNSSALIGEVSSTNEDVNDNHFYDAFPRFPEIVEDEAPYRLLSTEYPALP